MDRKYLKSRYFGALIILPFFVFLFLGGIYLKYAVLLLSLGGMTELYNAARAKMIRPLAYAGYLLCIAYYVTLGRDIDYRFIFFALILTLFILFFVPIFDRKYNYIDISMTLLTFLYVPVFFSFVVLVDSKAYGNYYVWLIFLASWMCDTCAYYTGRKFGKKKLRPEISPNKTVEGSIGGLLGCVIACGVYGAFIISRGVSVELIHFLIIGAVCGVVAQLGDLSGSSFKRFVGIKDYSSLIPGHGGILDRFESSLFSGLVIYFYLTFLLNIK
jgi:phosphatidate cytidylyltransferase